MFAALESLNDQTDETLVDDTNEDAGLDDGFDPSLELDEDDDDLSEALESLDDDFVALESLSAQSAAIENLLTLRETIATHGMSTSLLAYADADGYLASKEMVPAYESFTGTYKADSPSSIAALESITETVKESVGGFVKKAWDTLTSFVAKIKNAAKAVVAKFTGMFRKVEGADASASVEHKASPAVVAAVLATVTASLVAVGAITKLPIPKEVAAATSYRGKVVAYVKNIKIADPIRTYYRNTVTKYGPKVTAAKQSVRDAGTWTKTKAQDMYRNVINMFKENGAFYNAAGSVWKWAGNAFKAIKDGVNTGVRAVFGAVWSAATTTFSLMRSGLSAVGNFLWSIMKEVGKKLSSAKKGIASKLSRTGKAPVAAGPRFAERKAAAAAKRAAKRK